MVIVSGCGVSAPETLRGRKVWLRLAVMPVAVTSLGRRVPLLLLPDLRCPPPGGGRFKHAGATARRQRRLVLRRGLMGSRP